MYVEQDMKKEAFITSFISTKPFLNLLAGLLFISSSLFAQELILSRPAGNNVQDVPELVLIEAYKKLGISLKSNPQPGARALKSANNAKTDGEVSRIQGLSKKYQNLIQIPTVVTYIEGVVYTKDKVFEVDGWESLRPYKIGIVKGSRFVEKGTDGMNVHSVGEYETVMKLLQKGRVDIVVMPKLAGIKTINKLNLTDLKMLDKPVVVKNHYHYLNSKHKDLVPKISKILADMEKSGRIDTIRKAYFDAL